MSVKTTNVCSAGECNGECYRCRLRAVEAERARWEQIARELYRKCYLAGNFGPWSDDWTEDHAKRFCEDV